MFTATLKNIIDGTPCKNFTFFKLDEDGRYLLVEFRCEYNGNYDTPYSRYNDPIYRGEVVEFFIGVQGEDIYFEFDLAPNSTLFNARIFYHEKYGAFTKVIDERVVAYTVEHKENEYVATMKIPFEQLGGKDLEFAFNAYRIVSNGAEKEFQALNPVGEIDFHRRDKFIKLK